ncbi:ABC transporter permease [Paenibacillus sp. NPDC058071]|uniref:ABC transporter permease n=1 Tax=Paenibacillus sp. NPDC058071 TaxID=3346326 RepID=UPI0036DDAE62
MSARILRQWPLPVLLIVLAVMWETLPPLFGIPHYILPRLSRVLEAVWANAGLLGKHFLVTLHEALVGLAISAVAGTAVALWIDGSKLAAKMLYPLLIASQTIPIIALSPIMVLWFGYETGSKVAVVILFTFFPIAMNAAGGFRSADPDIGEMMQSMGAGRRALFLKWKLPSALPQFFTGLKMAAAISVGGATLGEWLGGEAGLGVYTKRASGMLRGDDVFAGVMLLSAMGLLLFLTVQTIERFVCGNRTRVDEE